MRLWPLLLLLGAALAGCAEFRPLEPDAVTPPAAPEPPAITLPARERILYTVLWNGIPAGESEFSFTAESGEYRTEASVQTVGLVSLLYGVSIEAAAVAGLGDRRTRRWGYRTFDGEETVKRVDVRIDPKTGEILSVIRTAGEVKRVDALLPGAMDPLSTIHFLRRSGLEDGSVYRSPMFTQWNLYRATTVVQGRERVHVPLGSFDAVFVRTDVRRRDESDPEAGSALGFWISDDEARIPIRIDVDTEVGRLSLRATKHMTGEAAVGR